jgi:regulator of sirC expression with transglutaminase-like and TPR domain
VAGGGAELARFREVVSGREPDLFEAALVIASLVDPSADLDEARRDVGSLAERVRVRLPGEFPHAALRRVLFEEEEFRGDSEDYDAPSNSSIVRVLTRRRGMPITLSLVAMEVGRIAGLRLTGVGLPGHFVVGGPDLPEGTFLDPFDGGALYDADGLSSRLGAIFGSPIPLSPDMLAPDPPRAILRRVLLNLRRSSERRERWEEALEALDFAEALEPDLAGHLRERGLLLLRSGRIDAAIEALETYASTTEGEDAEAVRRFVGALKGRAEGELVGSGDRKVFTLDEARALLPRVQELTEEAVSRYTALGEQLEEERQAIVRDWARRLHELGLEIKGLWLVDFDSGAGYYCWKYPEAALNHFHGYEEGFAGRLALQ